jgi:RND family efflux transporter MFP subunit
MLKRKILIPAVIIAFTIVAVVLITKNPPKGRKGRPQQVAQMTVEVEKLKPQSYQVMLDSFGTVKPRTQSVLVAQVAGQINYVSSHFRDGGFFEKGDVLVKIDDRDYQAEVKIAQSTLMAGKQTLLEEQARSNQALADWKRLGNGDEPSVLVLRKPQLESAKAKVMSAQAQLEKTQLKLERTQIVAPYAGRILKKKVDIGQVISTNSQLADIFAVDYVEIRLPIKNNDLALIDLPEEYRNSGVQVQPVPVNFQSDLIGNQSWQGEVVRTEGAIDNSAQQLYIVAQINNPYQSSTHSPIKIGQYVTAQIKGKSIDNALVIPNSAIYQGSYVYIVSDGVLIRTDIETRWQNSHDAIIASGLEFGDKLVLTSLGQVSSGTAVSILNEPSSQQARAGNDKKTKGKGDGKRKRHNKDDKGKPKKGDGS